MTDDVEARSLFDAEWYQATYPESAGQDAYEHFQRVGAAKGYDPNPLFSTRWYLSRYRDITDPGVNALEDFVSRGARLGRDPGPLFSTRWYLQRVPDLKVSGQNPLAYYLKRGFRELYDPSPLFNSAWYFATYPEAAGEGLDALLHFMHEGTSLGYSPSPHFDVKWYLDTYPEVAKSGQNPLLHYLLEGAAKGFDPGPFFRTAAYVEEHPDLAVSGENPLVHYLIGHLYDRQPKSALLGTRYDRLSHAAITDARALIEAFSSVEPDLLALPGDLGALRVPAIAPGRAEQAWRKLYLSLFERPRSIVLVDSIEDSPDLASILSAMRDPLVVETDSATVPVANALAYGTEWRAFSEFHTALDDEDRLRMTTSLINGLQPETLVVLGSASAWEMLAHHGKALARNCSIVVSDKPVGVMSAEEMMLKYFRHLAPIFSSVLSRSAEELNESAEKFGIPGKYRAKIQKVSNFSSMKSGQILDRSGR